MKATIPVLMVLVAITFAQKPIPIPSLNLNKIQGLWYVVAAYPSYENVGIDCFTMSFTLVSNDTINLALVQEGNDNSLNSTFNLDVINSGSVWIGPTGKAIAWISFDPINGAWGTFASYGTGNAVILSRSPSLNFSIIASQLALLQSEGYQANLTNTYFVPNNCTMGEFI